MTKKPTETVNVSRQALRLSDCPHADIIYFDESPNFSSVGGIVGITLAAHRSILQQDRSAQSDIVVTAYLRCSIRAAKSLRKALDDAILLGENAPGRQN